MPQLLEIRQVSALAVTEPGATEQSPASALADDTAPGSVTAVKSLAVIEEVGRADPSGKAINRTESSSRQAAERAGLPSGQVAERTESSSDQEAERAEPSSDQTSRETHTQTTGRASESSGQTVEPTQGILRQQRRKDDSGTASSQTLSFNPVDGPADNPRAGPSTPSEEIRRQVEAATIWQAADEAARRSRGPPPRQHQPQSQPQYQPYEDMVALPRTRDAQTPCERCG
jgi:hypothetical protein